MEDNCNPAKKPRLEDNWDAWETEFAGNDDLWGQDELTAEEFDMLETQASQSNEQQNVDTINVELCLPGPSNSLSVKVGCEDSLLEKYALEGKVKSLMNSLEKTVKELTDERLSREQIINSRLDQYKNKEISLLQKVDQLETAIHFKEQETRAERTKNLALECRLKEQTKESHFWIAQDIAEKSNFRNSIYSKKSPCKFLNRHDFEIKSEFKGVEVAAQTESLRCRKFQLSLQSPRGEIKGADMVSALLSAKVFTSSVFENFQECSALCSKEIYDRNEIFKKLPGPSATIALLNEGEELDNLWRSYTTVFQNYLPLLKKSNLNHLVTSILPQKTTKTSSSNSKYSSQKNSELDCRTIVYCLRDIAKLLFYRCPKQKQEEVPCASEKSKKVYWPKNETDSLPAHSRPIFGGEEEKMEIVEMEQDCSLAELLCAFANPDSYSAEYSKGCEVEWALLALLAWSSHSTVSLEPHVCNLPLHVLVSGKYGMESAYLSLKLMISFLTSNRFQRELVHQLGRCIFCNIGSLCHSIHSCLAYHSTCALITTVEDFLSGIFTNIDFALFNEESYPCSSLAVKGMNAPNASSMTTYAEGFGHDISPNAIKKEPRIQCTVCCSKKNVVCESEWKPEFDVLQGIVSMLWSATSSGQDHYQSCCFNALRKGIILLSFMANHVQNFRARRMPVEDNYISLICSLSRLCHENTDFKKLRDIIRELWDFQDDANEFDME